MPSCKIYFKTHRVILTSDGYAAVSLTRFINAELETNETIRDEPCPTIGIAYPP